MKYFNICIENTLDYGNYLVSSCSGFHASLVWLTCDEISLKLKPPKVVLQDSCSLIKG